MLGTDIFAFQDWICAKMQSYFLPLTIATPKW